MFCFRYQHIAIIGSSFCDRRTLIASNGTGSYAGPTRLVNGVGYRINQGIQAANSALLVVSLPTRTTCCCSSSLLAVSLLDTVEFTQIDF
jgi:hypothetical protein